VSTCYAQQFPVFQPAMRIMVSISQGNPAQITTSFAHQYNSGCIVRFDIPSACGMQQLNQQTGTITVTGDTTFTVPIDTSLYDSFSIPMSPPPSVNTCALVVPIGEDTEFLNSAVQNVLPYSAT
jgi:hypothetical protein